MRLSIAAHFAHEFLQISGIPHDLRESNTQQGIKLTLLVDTCSFISLCSFMAHANRNCSGCHNIYRLSKGFDHDNAVILHLHRDTITGEHGHSH